MQSALERLLAVFSGISPSRVVNLQDLLMNPEAMILVALTELPHHDSDWQQFDDPTYVGTLTLLVQKTLTSSRAHIEDVAVDPAQQGRGIGKS